VRLVASALAYEERDGLVYNQPTAALRRNLKDTGTNCEGTHIAPHARNFLPEDVIKRPWTDESLRTDMGRFINAPEHATTAEPVRVQQGGGCLVCNSRVAG
jgi:hypothetical protein